MLLGLVCEIRAHKKKCVIVLKAPGASAITGLHGAGDVLVAQVKLQQIERKLSVCLVSLREVNLFFLKYILCD